MRTVLLDNEAVSVLLDPAHSKHRRVLAVVEAVAARNLRRAGSVRLVVPTAVRVEAGWDRRDPTAAPMNRLRVDDRPLDGSTADRAATLRRKLGISVADAHLGAVLEADQDAETRGAAGPAAVLTSDPDDMRRIATHLDIPITIVTI